MSFYKSINIQNSLSFKEKGSKFIAFTFPCQSEDEIKNHLLELRQRHPQANHVCYAYRLGVEKIKYRANDDGEPNNSAGIPILGQIQSFNLTNILVAVVRYFGGTKLGVGGLVQAYKNAAKLVIESSEIVQKEWKDIYILHFSYEIMPEVLHFLKKNKIEVLEKLFSEDCEVKIVISSIQFSKLLLPVVHNYKINYIKIGS